MRLRFSRRTDYAIRAALELARDRDDLVTRYLVAAATGAPPSVAAQALADLTRAGLVRSVTGRRGGYALGRPAEQISVLDVVRSVEPSGAMPRCVLHERACSHTGACPFHATLIEAQRAFHAALAAESLADVAARAG